jgi:hypothetical protein
MQAETGIRLMGVKACFPAFVKRPGKRVVAAGAAACLAAGALAASPSPGDAPAIEVEASVSPARVHVGDWVEYRIAVRRDPGTAVAFEKMPGEWAGFEVEPLETREGSAVRNETAVRRRFRLRTFRTGDHVLPPRVIRYGKKEADRKIETGALLVRVDSRLSPGERDIRDILPPVEGRKGAAVLFPLMGIAAALVAAGAAFRGVRLWRRRQKARTVPERPPWERALRELDRLAKEDLLDKGRVREYYYRLSDILRRYIEARFSLMAPERTTEEFIKMMQSEPGFTKERQSILERFLRECDLVKFARNRPPPEETDRGTRLVRAFIEETVPVPDSGPDTESSGGCAGKEGGRP